MASQNYEIVDNGQSNQKGLFKAKMFIRMNASLTYDTSQTFMVGLLYFFSCRATLRATRRHKSQQFGIFLFTRTSDVQMYARNSVHQPKFPNKQMIFTSTATVPPCQK